MLAKVECLWTDGRQVPRWQMCKLKSAQGELRIEEGNDEYLRRFMRTARLFDFSKTPPDVLPPLRDMAVLWLKDNRMTISGFERDEMMKAYAQTWLVEILPCV